MIFQSFNKLLSRDNNDNNDSSKHSDLINPIIFYQYIFIYTSILIAIIYYDLSSRCVPFANIFKREVSSSSSYGLGFNKLKKQLSVAIFEYDNLLFLLKNTIYSMFIVIPIHIVTHAIYIFNFKNNRKNINDKDEVIMWIVSSGILAIVGFLYVSNNEQLFKDDTITEVKSETLLHKLFLCKILFLSYVLIDAKNIRKIGNTVPKKKSDDTSGYIFTSSQMTRKYLLFGLKTCIILYIVIVLK